jgi:hypothetical protein
MVNEYILRDAELREQVGLVRRGAYEVLQRTKDATQIPDLTKFNEMLTEVDSLTGYATAADTLNSVLTHGDLSLRRDSQARLPIFESASSLANMLRVEGQLTPRIGHLARKLNPSLAGLVRPTIDSKGMDVTISTLRGHAQKVLEYLPSLN